MKIEIDVDIPEGYEATGVFNKGGSYSPDGYIAGWVQLRKKKREVIVFEKVDEFVEYSASIIPLGWGSDRGNTSSPIALYAKGTVAFHVQWYRRKVELRD